MTDSLFQWDIAEFDHKICAPLANASGVNPLIAHLLRLRGADTPDRIRDFLHPRLAHLSSPFDLPDMSTAVDRILLARQNNDSVLVFGDFDVDGITATALLTRALDRFGIKKVSNDMPDRFSEGYGLTPAHVEKAVREGYQLIITVDNGTSAHEAAEKAVELGIDLIITDHHSLEETLPPALAVINPKRVSPDHPAYMLAGVGVAFKLAMALNGTPNDLDIAALGTVSDIVPLLEENRTITTLGLRHMIQHQRLGIAKLAQAARFHISQVNAQKIGFQLGPRLNAAGRMETGHDSLRLLLSEDANEATELARRLNEINEERRAIEQEIYDQARRILDPFFKEEQRSIVLYGENWHQGVIGIVASRVLSRYRRPVIICCMGEDGLLHGSGRSIPEFDMITALNACAGYLERFGGHKAAAGVTLRLEAMDEFREAFEEQAALQLGTDKLKAHLLVDAPVVLSQIDHAFVRGLEKMEPFGQNNAEPLFCAFGVELVTDSVQVLKEHHLKFFVHQNDTTHSVLGFYKAERFCSTSIPRRMDLVFSPHFNTYNGNTTIQLLLQDLRSA
jgi:single-stranded-DNA-specific exonuclease